MSSHFRVTGHFETSTRKDPQKTLNTTRSKVHHMCVTGVPESQIPLRFALRPAFFKISHIHLYNSPLTTMLNGPRKNKKKKCQKVKISNFTILLITTLVETLLRSIHKFGGVNLVHTFRGETFTPIWSHVNEKEKNVKNPKFEISQFFEQL